VTEVPTREFRRALRNIAAKPASNPLRLEAEALWRPAILELREQVAKVLQTAEGLELNMALETGSVTLISDGTRFEDSIDQQIKWFRDRLTQALAAPSTTVLLDQVSSEFLRE